jgi:hypothetical protein
MQQSDHESLFVSQDDQRYVFLKKQRHNAMSQARAFSWCQTDMKNCRAMFEMPN